MNEEKFITQISKLNMLEKLFKEAITVFRDKETSEYDMNIYRGNNCLRFKIAKDGYPIIAIFKIQFYANIIVTFVGGVKASKDQDSTYFRRTLFLDKKVMKKDPEYLSRRILSTDLQPLVDHCEKMVGIHRKETENYNLRSMTTLVLKNELEEMINRSVKYLAGTLYLHSYISREKNKPSKITVQYKHPSDSREVYYDVVLNFEAKTGTFKLFRPDLADRAGFIQASEESLNEMNLTIWELKDLMILEKKFNEFFQSL